MDDVDIQVELVPIAQIAVLNPRARNRRTHREITDNIEEIGLKRPVTLARRRLNDGGERYDLVCGEGRLEAFQALGQSYVPAIVVELAEEACLVRSLVENIARPIHRGVDNLREVSALKKRGYSDSQIADKIGASPSWVNMIATLLEKGEERLIAAVESGIIPITLAMTIARSDDAGVQQALADAYADGKIKGRNVETVRKLLERRRRNAGIGRGVFGRSSHAKRPTPEMLLEVFRREADRQRLITKKADFVQSRLLFVVQALKELRLDASFKALLRVEGLDTMPRALDGRIAGVA
jgi:ParB family transcriptional regulator, chromosome partitioning protein